MEGEGLAARAAGMMQVSGLKVGASYYMKGGWVALIEGVEWVPSAQVLELLIYGRGRMPLKTFLTRVQKDRAGWPWEVAEYYPSEEEEGEVLPSLGSQAQAGGGGAPVEEAEEDDEEISLPPVVRAARGQRGWRELEHAEQEAFVRKVVGAGRQCLIGLEVLARTCLRDLAYRGLAETVLGVVAVSSLREFLDWYGGQGSGKHFWEEYWPLWEALDEEALKSEVKLFCRKERRMLTRWWEEGLGWWSDEAGAQGTVDPDALDGALERWGSEITQEVLLSQPQWGWRRRGGGGGGAPARTARPPPRGSPTPGGRRGRWVVGAGGAVDDRPGLHLRF